MRVTYSVFAGGGRALARRGIVFEKWMSLLANGTLVLVLARVCLADLVRSVIKHAVTVGHERSLLPRFMNKRATGRRIVFLAKSRGGG